MSELESGFETTPKEEELELSRKAALITLARVENYQELLALSREEGEEKFLEKTKELWKEFAVHGVWGVDKKTGEKVILNFTDLDGRSALGLLRLAGIKTSEVKYVSPSEYIRGRINLDTGDKYGLIIEDEGKTAILDHHVDNSGRTSSATKITYEVLVSLGLLKKEDYLNRLVNFVTQVDNRTFPDEEKYFSQSHRTVLGLQRFIEFKHLLDYFRAVRNPVEILSDGDLKKMGLERQSKEQEKNIKSSLEELKKMEEEGFIIDSPRYEKIAVDIGKKVKAGFDGAKAMGCGGYIIWSPDESSFFISTISKLEHQFPQGKKIRETMWIKPRHETTKLTLTLSEVLHILTDGQITPSRKLKEYLDKEGEEK